MGQALPLVQEEEALQSLHSLACLFGQPSTGPQQRQDSLENPLFLAAETDKLATASKPSFGRNFV